MRFRMLLIFLLFLVSLEMVSGQYIDPNFAKPTFGYGSDGIYSMEVIRIGDPYFPGEKIEIFHPKGVEGPVPAIFFCHGYGGVFSNYVGGMLQFLVSKGYAVVFAPYPTLEGTIVEKYGILIAGLRLAARTYPDIIDTTRVGFVGHSFGGGAMFGIAYQCFSENEWGQDGRFLFSLAPWYAFELTQDQLTSFPPDTKLLMQVYDGDKVNDHRMAIDLFKNINIPGDQKDYLMVQSDTIGIDVYEADHGLPGTFQVFNALDYYALYRLLDALADYTFNGNEEGRVVALGHGEPAQISMPIGLSPLVHSDQPEPLFDEDHYEFNCSALLNLRREYCSPLVAVREGSDKYGVVVTPNPFQSHITFTWPINTLATHLQIFNLMGQQVYTRQLDPLAQEITIELNELANRQYFFRIGKYLGRFIKIGN
ncbi:MAG: alpha/beta hydrolase [Saprospiraceae bacterium]|nr:alpha/beta hydrolase [Saprospiraceae bacterium]